MIVCEPGKHTDDIRNASVVCSPSSDGYSPYRQKYTEVFEQGAEGAQEKDSTCSTLTIVMQENIFKYAVLHENNMCRKI
jgi:hypothetical protein